MTTCCKLPLPLLTGEQVSAPEPGGQDERDGSNGGGEVETLCQQGGGEEPGPYSEVGGEVTRIHWQLPGAFWKRRRMGMFTFISHLTKIKVKKNVKTLKTETLKED